MFKTNPTSRSLLVVRPETVSTTSPAFLRLDVAACWVCKRVNSPRVKLLYDIYHMQIMEGDIARTIRENLQYIAHFHTGGNPGRHEINGTQELDYHFVAQAIADAGFQGYIAHEYSPAQENDPLKSLDEAMRICDV